MATIDAPTITTYSNAAATNATTQLQAGTTAYIEGYITSLSATTDTSLVINLYDENDLQVGDSILDTTHSFAANTATKISTINGGMLSFTVPSTPGRYYLGQIIDDAIACSLFVWFYSYADLTITSPSISESTITDDMGVTISCTVSADTDVAFVTFFNSSSEPVYTIQMDITGTSATCTTKPGDIPADTYGAGDITIYAIDTASRYAYGSDSTLTLTVTAAGGLKTGAKRWLNETVYIKYHTGLDDNGYVTYGDWTSVSARIERTTQKVLDASGVQVTSNAQIHVSGDNAVGILDRVKFSNDFSTTAEARIIRVNTLSDAGGSDEMKVVFV